MKTIYNKRKIKKRIKELMKLKLDTLESLIKIKEEYPTLDISTFTKIRNGKI